MLPDKNYEDDISNLLTISEVKELFITNLGDKGVGLKPANLRFFCLGKELVDDFYIYSYDLTDNFTI